NHFLSDMKGVAVGVLSLVLSCVAFSSEAYISGIAISSEARTAMQVYVNGKLYNTTPNSFVRAKSLPGLFHGSVRVLNHYDKRYYLVTKDIRVEKGLEFYYKVVFERGKRPELREVRGYPVYSKYFLDPSLYTRHSTT